MPSAVQRRTSSLKERIGSSIGFTSHVFEVPNVVVNLMVCAVYVPDSMMCNVSVPCARNPRLWFCRFVVEPYTNSFPIVIPNFLFRVAHAFLAVSIGNVPERVTRIILRPKFPERLPASRLPSLQAVVYESQGKLVTDCFCKSTPATLESTLQRLSKTFLWPTFSRIFAGFHSIKLSIDQINRYSHKYRSAKLQMSFP